MKVRLEFKKQDKWVGVYHNPENIFICILPCIVIHIHLDNFCRGCGKRIKGSANSYKFYHDDKKWIKYSEYSDELVTCSENKRINDEVDEECS